MTKYEAIQKDLKEQKIYYSKTIGLSSVKMSQKCLKKEDIKKMLLH